MITIVIETNFGERLKELRKSHSLSQRKLAEALNLAQSSIFSYEKGQKSPTAEVIIRAADYFEVSADYLLGLTDDPHGDISNSMKKRLEMMALLEAENEELKKKIKAVLDALLKNDGGIGEQ